MYLYLQFFNFILSKVLSVTLFYMFLKTYKTNIYIYIYIYKVHILD